MTPSDTHLFKLTSLLFNAALGHTYYRTFAPVLEQIGIESLARNWGNSDVTTSVLGDTPAEQARNLALHLNLNPDSSDTSSGDYIAHQFFLSNLESGLNVGTLALAAIRYLEQDAILPSLETTRSFLNNRAETAYQYSKELAFGGTDINSLQAVLDGVTEDDLSITNTLSDASASVFDEVRASSTLKTYSGDDDNITGTDDSDYIDAGAGFDTIDGGAGADIILGGTGDDVINGGRGQDLIEGGDGADLIKAGSFLDREFFNGYYDDDGHYVSSRWVYTVDAFYETLNGGSGADTIYGGYGSDTIDGGSGSDRLYGEENSMNSSVYDQLDSTVLARLLNDTIYGGGGDDFISGGAGNDQLYGGEGDDNLNGESGNDVVHGGLGADDIDTGRGSDIVHGDAGSDNIRLYNYNRSESEQLDHDVAYGGLGDDSIYGLSNSEMDGGDGDDFIQLFRSENNQADGVVIAGEGADIVYITNADSRASSLVRVDLTETVAEVDRVEFSLASRITSAVEIQGFDLARDLLDFNHSMDIFASEGRYGYDSTSSAKKYNYSNELIRDYVQIVDSADTPWQQEADEPQTVDQHGKAFFVIQGAQAASGSIEDVAALIDNYGANAQYDNGYEHLFLVNISDSDLGVYLFKDDTGANNRIVSDELTPLAILTGVTTEDVTQANADFLVG